MTLIFNIHIFHYNAFHKKIYRYNMTPIFNIHIFHYNAFHKKYIDTI